MGLHSFVYACQICKILSNFELRTAQVHPRSSMLVPIESDRICSFLLIINSNFWRISYRFRDIDAFSSYISFSPSHPAMPRSGGTPCDFNIIYTLLESTFNGPQFRRWQYGSVFIYLAVVWFPNLRNPVKFREFDLVTVQGHPRLSIFVSIKTAYIRLPVSH